MWPAIRATARFLFNTTLLTSLLLIIASCYMFIEAPVLELRTVTKYTIQESDELRETGLRTSKITSLYEISPSYILSVLVMEDPQFLLHNRLDVAGIGQSLFDSLVKWKPLTAGNTISQQLVRRIFLPRRDTIYEKWLQIIYAVKLETYFSKEEILTLYFDTIQFSDRIVGVKEATRAYFNTTPKSLHLREAMLLAFLTTDPANRISQLKSGSIDPEIRSTFARALLQIYQHLKSFSEKYGRKEATHQAVLDPNNWRPMPAREIARLSRAVYKEAKTSYEQLINEAPELFFDDESNDSTVDLTTAKKIKLHRLLKTDSSSKSQKK